MRVTGLAQRDAWKTKTMPPVEQVRPGLWSLPVPIPDSPLRYTLTYLIGAGDGLVVVDPGWDTEAGWQALQAGLATAGASAGDVAGVIVTHVHPDHHGMSGRLREASGAWIAMHPAERDTLPARLRQHARSRQSDRDWLRSCGVPADVAAEVTVTDEGFQLFASMAEPDILLEDKDLAPIPGRSVRAVWTPGHTPGHLCLYEETEDLLLTGDHVLPRISPNIGSHPHLAEAPLGAYLSSLDRVIAYDSAEVLPAHEYRFHGLADRVRMLQAHHDRRCQEILDVLARQGPATIWQVAQQLSWSRGWPAVTGFMRRAAVAETAAHLMHLIELGQAEQLPAEPGEPVRYAGKPSEAEPPSPL